ncbi:hypothetical protein D3C78_1385890 [compost metagenome]
MFANAAGALSQRISRNNRACSSTASSPPTIFSASSISGWRSKTMATPANAASSSGCIKARANPCGFCAPRACAVRPVVLIRRNNNSMNRKLVAIAPTATPPR